MGVLRKSFHGARVPGIFDSFPARERVAVGLGWNEGKNKEKMVKRKEQEWLNSYEGLRAELRCVPFLTT